MVGVAAFLGATSRGGGRLVGRRPGGWLLSALGAQLLATLTAAAVAWLGWGQHAAVSAASGGAAVWLPNALFALRIAIDLRKTGGTNPATFFVGEFAKVALTALLLFAVARFYADLVWGAFLAGLVVALKSYIIVLFFKR